MKRPLLPVALCYVGGLLLAEAVRAPLLFLFAASFTLLVIATCLARARHFLLWPLLVLIGWTNLTQRTAVLSPHDLRVVAGHDPTIATIRGTLTETPGVRIHERGGEAVIRSLVPLDVMALCTNGHWRPATGRVIVSTRGELSADFFAGRTVEITGVLAPPSRPSAPGLFDYRTHLARQGIHYQLKADLPRDWRLVDASTAPPFADRFVAWAQRTLARGLPAQDEPLRLLWAMTLGWKTALTGEVSEPFQKSGTMHIFAITELPLLYLRSELKKSPLKARLPPLVLFAEASFGTDILPLVRAVSKNPQAKFSSPIFCYGLAVLPVYRSECFKCSPQLRAYLFASSASWIIKRFSAFFSSAAFVKLKLPVMTVAPSKTMIFEWAMACLPSVKVAMPALCKKSADE